jgi:hypothetical protein
MESVAERAKVSPRISVVGQSPKDLLASLEGRDVQWLVWASVLVAECRSS